MSKKPDKSRKAQYTRAMHKAIAAVAAHLNEKLAKELGKRSVSVRKNDVVKVMRGEFAGKEGKITSIDRKTGRVYIEKLVKKKSNGQERQVPVHSSNLLVIDVEKTDRKRFGKKGEKK